MEGIQRKTKKRIVMVPAPFEGHLSPMMNLATALFSRGFSITIVRTQFNFYDISSHFPNFRFLTIADGLSESDMSSLGLVDFVLKLNSICEPLFKHLLVHTFQNHDEDDDDVVCVIYDEFVYFPRGVAEDLNLGKMVFSASCVATSIARYVLMDLEAAGSLPPQESKSQQEELVPGFHPLRFRDLPATVYGSMEKLMILYENVSNRYTSSAIIHNTADCLESSSISRARSKWKVPVFSVGPLHKTDSVVWFPTSLPEEKSCIQWLDKQKPNSVIYISMGSLAMMQEEELLEMAKGLVQSRQPFLWVIRPGSIPGFESQCSSLEEFRQTLKAGERGCVVKWAPQKEVLAHRAVGGIWSHSGWNSSLESISSGVPLICRPYSGDQRVNTRYMSEVWGVAIEVTGRLDRGLVERAVRRLMVGQEGEEMKKKAMSLRQSLEASVRVGGSSCNSLDELAALIKSFPLP